MTDPAYPTPPTTPGYGGYGALEVAGLVGPLDLVQVPEAEPYRRLGGGGRGGGGVEQRVRARG